MFFFLTQWIAANMAFLNFMSINSTHWRKEPNQTILQLITSRSGGFDTLLSSRCADLLLLFSLRAHVLNSCELVRVKMQYPTTTHNLDRSMLAGAGQFHLCLDQHVQEVLVLGFFDVLREPSCKTRRCSHVCSLLR